METMEKETCGHEECGRHCRRKYRGYHHHSFAGGIWIIGWLFTIGFLKLSFAQGALALLLWPYYLGAALSIIH